MEPTSRDGRTGRRPHQVAPARPWSISALTQQQAQDADSSMARDEWKDGAPAPDSAVPTVFESTYFLP